jgi:tetratricopeptide (TPR) repeat protein
LALSIYGCGHDGALEPPDETPPPAADVVPPAPAEPAVLDAELGAIFGLIQQRQTDAARRQLDAYVKEHPDEGRAAFLLGLSHHREKRYARARPHFERAVEQAPSYHPTYHFLGWCTYYMGETAASRRAFEQHLAYVPTEGDSHFAIGLIDFDEDRLDDAQQRFRRAIELQQGNTGRRADVSKAHARLADVYIRRDELAAARAELETATQLWPQHYAAFYKLSRVLTRLGETEAAAAAFRKYRYWEPRAEQRRGIPEGGS